MAVVLITGASSGIGRATAHRLAKAGHQVFGTSRNPAPSDTEDVTMLRMDVCDTASVESAVAELLERTGRIDVLVNNAGMGIAGALEETSDAEALGQFDTNFFGVHRVCRAVLPTMRAQGSGRVVNVSSLGGQITLPFQGFYCASKYALEAYTESLRMEVRGMGIHVTMVEPGDFKTEFTNQRQYVGDLGEASPYFTPMRASLDQTEHDERNGAAPDRVAQTIERAITARNPRIRYPVAALLQRLGITAKWLLPARWFEFIIRRMYGV